MKTPTSKENEMKTTIEELTEQLKALRDSWIKTMLAQSKTPADRNRSTGIAKCITDLNNVIKDIKQRNTHAEMIREYKHIMPRQKIRERLKTIVEILT